MRMRLLARRRFAFDGRINPSIFRIGRIRTVGVGIFHPAKVAIDFERTGIPCRVPLQRRHLLVFSQEHFNELHLYRVGGDSRHQGYVRIESGPAHDPYGLFCVAPGHQLGFNDLKAIEVARFVDAIRTRSEPFNFRAGQRIQALVQAIQHSAREERWVSLTQEYLNPLHAERSVFSGGGV